MHKLRAQHRAAILTFGLLLVGLLTGATVLHAQTCPATLNVGGVAQCTLAATAEVDQLTITAQAGDRLILRASRTAGNIQLRLRLRTSQGALVSEAFTYGAIVELGGVAIPADDSYTLFIDDRQGTGTGAYVVSLQRLNGPAQPTALAFGVTQPATLLVGGEMDAYAIAGQAGDRLLLRMSSGSSAFSPQLRLYQPDGALLCSASSYGNTASNTQVCALPTTGAYLLLANEWNEGSVGSYYLTAQRLNEPGQATPIPYGVATSGSLVAPAEIDAFTIDGASGDIVIIRMARASGTVQPVVQLYAPDGTQVCSSSTYGIVTEKNNCPLPQTGRYTLLAYDLQEGRTGGYGVFIQRLNAPEQAIGVLLGTPITGQVILPGALTTYTFAGAQGDAILARLAGDGISPVLNIYGPGGVWVCGQYSYGTVTEAGPCLLPGNGTYTVLPGDFTDGRTGSYTLHLQRLVNPAYAEPLLFGRPTLRSLTSAGQLATFSFVGNAGAKLRVRAAGSSSGLNPSVRLYSPDGLLICTAQTFGTSVETGDCLLPADGSYTLIFTDYSQANLGSYTMALACLIDSCGPGPIYLPVYLPMVRL